MALPTSRTELVSYIKRRLGYPVIQVDVDDTQISDRIDDAIAFLQEYHFDGSERTYMVHQITASNLLFTGASTGTFQNLEYVRGATSNALGKVYQQANTTVLQFTYANANPTQFSAGETVTGETSGATATLSSNSSTYLVLGDVDNRYIVTSNLIMSIIRVVHPAGLIYNPGETLFNPFYQFISNDIAGMQGIAAGGLSNYFITRSHLEMLHDMLVGDINLRFNRHVNKLYLDIDWRLEMHPGRYIVCEVIRALDPATYSDMWADRFLRDYSTALTKKQWGQNLTKFKGVQMPGGIELNARDILEDGAREVDEIEKTVLDRYSLPPDFIVA